MRTAVQTGVTDGTWIEGGPAIGTRRPTTVRMDTAERFRAGDRRRRLVSPMANISFRCNG